MVGEIESKPVVFDDTINFVPCPSREAAELLLGMLESKPAQTLYRSFLFWDAKRPITVDLLSRLNLYALALELGLMVEFERHFGPMGHAVPKRTNGRRESSVNLTLWP
jgi:hypothetical protein